MANNQFVTRAEFESFLAVSEILQGVPEAQRKLLFDVGKSVCQIKNPDGDGTGFHLGGGWIMTALHVISDEKTMGAEYVSASSFHFPTMPVIEAASRPCVFSNFRGVVAEDPTEDTVKDLTLIYVPELDQAEYNTIRGLNNPYQAPPQPGDRVYLVHFGEIDGGGDQTPQQFSVNGKVTPGQEVNHPSGNRYSTHSAYCREGSSGAPLLLYRKKRREFLLAGVHFAGSETDANTGYALWFSGKNWLHHTVGVASEIARILRDTSESDISNSPILQRDCEKFKIRRYDILQKNLQTQNLRLIVNTPRPGFLQEAFYEDIIFQSE